MAKRIVSRQDCFNCGTPKDGIYGLCRRCDELYELTESGAMRTKLPPDESQRSLKIVPMPVRNAPDDDPWSPLDCLRTLLADIESGKAKPKNLMVFYMEDDPNDPAFQFPIYWIANMTNVEAIALLALAQHKAVDRWRKVE